jgi:hypothetical protein
MGGGGVLYNIDGVVIDLIMKHSQSFFLQILVPIACSSIRIVYGYR